MLYEVITGQPLPGLADDLLAKVAEIARSGDRRARGVRDDGGDPGRFGELVLQKLDFFEIEQIAERQRGVLRRVGQGFEPSGQSVPRVLAFGDVGAEAFQIGDPPVFPVV